MFERLFYRRKTIKLIVLRVDISKIAQFPVVKDIEIDFCFWRPSAQARASEFGFREINFYSLPQIRTELKVNENDSTASKCQWPIMFLMDKSFE